MPNFIIITLFILSFTFPALGALIVWASKPKTIEELLVKMTLTVLGGTIVHIGFAIWLLPQYSISEYAYYSMGVLWFACLIVEGVCIYGAFDEAKKRFEKEDGDSLAVVRPHCRKAN